MMDDKTLAATPRAMTADAIGRVVAISGAQATIGIGVGRNADTAQATVGKFLAIHSDSSLTIGMITEITEKPPAVAREHGYGAAAQLDLIGEIKQASTADARFQRGVTDYPAIGNAARPMHDDELRQIYHGRSVGSSGIGEPHPDVGG